MLRPVLLLIISLILSGCTNRGIVPSEFVAREVNGRGYRVYVPADRDPNKKVPVLLYLHGAGARGDDNIEQVDGFRWAMDPVKDKINFVVVLPQCEGDNFWAAQNMTQYALAALDSTVTEFNGDTDRLYLAGFSLGGYGVWHIAAGYPQKFAALIPVAGGVTGTYPINPSARRSIIPSVGDMLESPEPYNAVARSIGNTPVWVFHGAKDDSVSVEFSRTIVGAFKAIGRKDVKYTEYPEDGHQIFAKAISEPGLLEWLSEQHK